VLCPGATATNFFAVAGADNSMVARRLRRMMRADSVARLGYRALAAGRPVVITGLLNRVLALSGRFAPHRVSLPVTELLMSGE
jgi:short-subunit dehydrogenase